MKSFSRTTKEELAFLEKDKDCCALSELLGLMVFAGSFSNNSIKIQTENDCIAIRFQGLFNELFDYYIPISIEGNYYVLIIDKLDIILKIYSLLRIIGNTPSIPYEYLKKDCCKSSFLRGTFLASGIIMDPRKNYNLEFVLKNEALALNLKGFLESLGFLPKITKRKKYTVIYMKSNGMISDFLGYIKAINALNTFSDVVIQKEFTNNFNRSSNLDIANTDKIYVASSEHIKAIMELDESVGLDTLPEELREIAFLRIENPELSLTELGKLCIPPITKSGVNHRLKKIIKLAERG